MLFWIELLGSISLAIALVSAVVLIVHHVKKRRNEQKLPFGEFNRICPQSNATIVQVTNEEEIASRHVKYGIQWNLPLSKDQQIEPEIPTLSAMISKQTTEFDQGDSVSFGDDTTTTFSSVRNLIQQFENSSCSSNSVVKCKSSSHGTRLKKNHASIETGEVDRVVKTPMKIDVNQNQQQLGLKDLTSHHSSISNLDVTVPSNLSSSIDLEQFVRNDECFSMTSNLSEYLNNNQFFIDR